MESSHLRLYRGCSPAVDTQFDVDGNESPSTAIIDALAAATGIPPTELPPLYEFVDPDAIDRLFTGDRARSADTVLSFRVERWNVFVREDGRIRICDATDETAPEPIFDRPTA